jgi:hypothetical protein
MPGRGSGASARAGGMKNWNYGLQLCYESQEWYILLRTFFVPDDAFTTPAPDGKTRTFKFNSDIYLDLDEDPDARRQRLLLKQKFHGEQAEPAAQKPADRLTSSRIRTVVAGADGKDGTEQGMLQKNYPVSFTYYSPIDDSRHCSRDGFRDAPILDVSLHKTSDADFLPRLDEPAADPGVAAAAVVCEALVKKNMASAMDLELLMPTLQTILHPDYLSALYSGRIQIPAIPQIRAVASVPPSSPDSVMLGSQILNTRRDAQEIQARLNAARQSNKRQWHYDNSTSDSDNKEGPSQNLLPRPKKCASNQRKKRSHHPSSSGKSPSPNQPRRQQKDRQSNDGGALSDGRSNRSGRAPGDGEVPQPQLGADNYQPSAPNLLQGAKYDTIRKQ